MEGRVNYDSLSAYFKLSWYYIALCLLDLARARLYLHSSKRNRPQFFDLMFRVPDKLDVMKNTRFSNRDLVAFNNFRQATVDDFYRLPTRNALI